MINEEGKAIVHLAMIDYGEDEGGEFVTSVHDTHEGASKALKSQGFRPACVFTCRGELYAYKDKTADDCPVAYIDAREVMA